MRLFKFFGLDPKRFECQVLLVKLSAVLQNCRQTTALHVATDPFDDLLGGEGLAEKLDRPSSTRVGNDVAAGAEFVPQSGD
jgi:hypothetical protein